MMMNCNNNWERCTDIIHRLSSRIMNKQNQSVAMPSCIEKSFYQCQSNLGSTCCIEMCDNYSDPLRNKCKTSLCDTKINQQSADPIDLNRHQFALSKMFDNKRKYIDYVVTNVLRQVVNHISLDSLHQLSCCLPEQIEEVLRNVTDIDSDRLVRILVTQVLQCYGTNAGQVTDWYAFANSIKPTSLPSTTKDNDDGNENENQVSSKTRKLVKKKNSSDRIITSHIKSIFANTPVPPSPMTKKQSSESMAFDKSSTPATKSNLPSDNPTHSGLVTPQNNISSANSMTPMSIHSKETYTPTGTKYQSRTKPDHDFVFSETDRRKSLPFHEDSIDRSSPEKSETQYRRSTNRKWNKSSDRSSSSDCVLTIHHKHKHKRGVRYHHHRHHTTTSFDTPSSHSLSSHTSVPTSKLLEKYKQNSIDVSPTRTKSRQNINANGLKSSDLSIDEQMLLFKLFVSSENAAKHLHPTVNPSFQLPSYNESTSSVVSRDHSITEKHPLSSIVLSKVDLPINQNPLQANSEKKTLRINHYPNMLADFD